MNLEYKIKKKHRDNCTALLQLKRKSKMRWLTPWGIYKETIFTRENSLSIKGHTMWFVFGCNSTKCEAEIAVKSESVYVNLPAE